MSTAKAVEATQQRAETTTESQTADETVEQAELSKDDLFHILQNQRRRRVLTFLQDVDDDERVDMRDIAEQVAAWEHDTTLQQLTSDERQRVYIALYQSHLPKLDEKGIIDYNQSRGFVERTPLANQFEHYLAASEDEVREGASDADADADTETTSAETDDTASATTTDSARYYSGATALGLALTAMSWVGVAPTALSSYLATFITGMFLFVTVGVAYQNRR
ncbi:hypothetical protein SAMN04487950_4125 [Halogranum rubrum]|uniref:DUF7344 domain-containing protein n=1 Tax=Halogranum rubrum TaxID=553466 RepID=A0A1I4II40_9EURY|nr:hypothetical protein [Halogranum rubrum]SFL53737.1 hypothetical protein SAMN04487950_4125 [Halogranum rubrum]